MISDAIHKRREPNGLPSFVREPSFKDRGLVGAVAGTGERDPFRDREASATRLEEIAMRGFFNDRLIRC